MRIKIVIRRLEQRFFSFVFSLLPKKKQIVFQSFDGKQYSDNPRAISEKMHSLFPEYDIVWLIRNNSDAVNYVPEYVKVRSCHELRIIYEISRSICFVNNMANEMNLHKRKQIFIQTWHGDIVPKKVLYDAWEDGKRPVELTDCKLTDFCVAGSDLGSSVYRTAFRYDGKILKIGMPRNDKLVIRDKHREQQTKRSLSIPNEAKILLYAPTFRDNHTNSQDVTVDLKQVMKILEGKGEKWVCLVRAHSGTKHLSFKCDGTKYIEASSYPDMADLLAISDMLITDYSSSAGDFILRNKPAILAFFDKEEYISGCRQFNMDPEEAGFIIAKTQNQMNEILRTKSEEDYANNCKRLKEHFGIIANGDASEKICILIDRFYRGSKQEDLLKDI